MQQQEIVKVLIDGQKFKCESHPEYQLQTIYFGDNKQQKKSRFFCQECLIEASEDAKNLNNYAIPIQKFLKHPDFIVDKILTLKNNDLLAQETQIINKLNEDIDKLEGLLKQQIDLMRQNLQNIQFKSQIADLKNEILNKVDINELNNGLQVVLQMDSHQGTKEFQQLEVKLNASSQYFQQMRNGALNRIEINQRGLVNKLHQNIQTIQQELHNLARIIMGQLSTMTTACIPQSIYDEIRDFPQIHQEISDGRKIDYQLIYEGSKDWLSSQQYWAKCNGKSHLLTIMTSKNGYRFGGYSPCFTNVDLGSYVEDPTMKSFLFQYNKKEIYKIKYSKNAIYCKSEFGPTFGGGYDLYIGEDFKNKGYSKGLGHSYDISNYKIADKSTHLFGGPTPQLQECKVYKVLFT